MLNGGCYCGAIRYRVTERIANPTNCHCEICRRTTGAPYVAWFSVPSADFVFLVGNANCIPLQFACDADILPRCGTQLTFVDDASPGETDITIGSLDEPDGVAPHDHTFTSGKLAWLKLADGLPRISPPARRRLNRRGQAFLTPPGLSVPVFGELTVPAPWPGLVPSPSPERLSFTCAGAG